MNKKNTTYLLVFSAITIISLIYWWRNKNANTTTPSSPETLPEMLKKAYNDLKSQGYNPITNPVSHPSRFITFTISDVVDMPVVSTINDQNGIVIAFDKNKPPFTAKYTDGQVISKGQVIAEDDDVVSAILQIIENKDYE